MLELSTVQYRKLGSLKEAVAQLRVGMDGLLYDRVLRELRDIAGQLGPIGAAVEVLLSVWGCCCC